MALHKRSPDDHPLNMAWRALSALGLAAKHVPAHARVNDIFPTLGRAHDAQAQSKPLHAPVRPSKPTWAGQRHTKWTPTCPPPSLPHLPQRHLHLPCLRSRNVVAPPLGPSLPPARALPLRRCGGGCSLRAALLRTPWLFTCTCGCAQCRPWADLESDIEAFRHACRPISVMRPGAHGIRQAVKWSADAKGVMPAARTHASGGAHSSPPGDRGDGPF